MKIHRYKFSDVILTLVFFLVLIFSSYAIEYSSLLVCLSILCVSGVFLERGFLFLVLLMGVYLIIGFAPLSSYRGEMQSQTVWVYILFLLGLFGSILFFAPSRSYKIRRDKLIWTRRAERFFALHLVLIWLGVFYLYMVYGNILINQDERFSISPSVSYLVKSGLYSAIYIVCVKGVGSWKEVIKYILLPVVPSILIGSRGNVVIFMMAVGIYYFLIGRGVSLRAFMTAVGWAGLAFFIISGIFYLRRSGDGAFISVDELIYSYFYSDDYFSYVIAPLHVAFRETIGITNRIVTSGLSNEITSYPLLFADIYTVLPGEQVAAGRALGEMMGVIGGGGLTPGIVGGVFLDYGSGGVLLAAIVVGVVLSYLRRQSFYSSFWLVVFCLSIAQFFHLFHRGFLKPEYVLAYIIIFFYYRLTLREDSRKNENFTRSLSVTSKR